MDNKAAINYKEGVHLFFENSYKAIPFNLILAVLLVLALAYDNSPLTTLGIWLFSIVLVTAARWLFCKYILKNYYLSDAGPRVLIYFVIMTAINGLLWGSIYFINYPDISGMQEYLVLLVYAGMSAGATTSLSIYFPAFLAYTLPIFIPVVIYNFSLARLDYAILATMYLLFIVALSVVAITNERLFRKILFLSGKNRELVHKLEKLSITDHLTGLYNKRHFVETLDKECNRAKRNKYPLTLVYIDIDNFKLINDNFGHPCGDRLLNFFSDVLINLLHRANDMAFRLGGDEFALILANSSLDDAKNICEKIKNRFMQTKTLTKPDVELQNEKYIEIISKISVSMGVVCVSCESSVTLEKVISEADKNLYEAKNLGKNRIIYSSQDN